MKPAGPTADQVKKCRSATGLSQRESADLIHVSRAAWQTYEKGTVTMKLGLWELYQFKTGQIWVRPLALKAERRATLRQGRHENLTPFKAKSKG